MYVELVREMNDRELSLLNKWVNNTTPPVSLVGTLKWISVWTLGMLLCLLVICGGILLHPIAGGLLGGVFGVGAILCLYAIIMLTTSYFHWTRRHSESVKVGIPILRAAIADGRVSVKQVHALAAIEIEPYEDEGQGVLYDVGESKTLFLKGQWVYPVDDEMPWPNTDFEIVSTVVGDRSVGIFCSGAALNPMRTISTSDCNPEVTWDDCEKLVDGALENVANSIIRKDGD